MSEKRLPIQDSSCAVFGSVRHPYGHEKGFVDAFKRTLHLAAKLNNNATVACAVTQTGHAVRRGTMQLLSRQDLNVRNAACDESASMPPDGQHPWIERLLSSYPKLDALPDPDSHNDRQ